MKVKLNPYRAILLILIAFSYWALYTMPERAEQNIGIECECEEAKEAEKDLEEARKRLNEIRRRM